MEMKSFQQYRSAGRGEVTGQAPVKFVGHTNPAGFMGDRIQPQRTSYTMRFESEFKGE